MTPEVFVLAGAAAAVVGYLVGWFGHGEHRKGCNECAADLRRKAEQQEELAHDYAHRVMGQNCEDERCPRNKVARDD